MKPRRDKIPGNNPLRNFLRGKIPATFANDENQHDHRAFLAGAFGLMCTHLRVAQKLFDVDQLLGELSQWTVNGGSSSPAASPTP
jgi:hypothetical protein